MKTFKNPSLVLAVALSCLLVVGCSQGPDFSEPSTVISKDTGVDGISTYTLNHDSGVRGAGLGPVLMNAPQDFARVGDTIFYKDGSIVVEKFKHYTDRNDENEQ